MNSTANVDVLLSNDLEGLSERKEHRFEVEFIPEPPFPREVFFDVSSACNHWCFFCANPTQKLLKGQGLIDEKLVCRLLDEVSQNGTTQVGLYSTGEPFMHKGLARMTAKAKSVGIPYVFMSTNGALATPKRAKPVLDAGMDSIKFSVNAGTRDSYKNVHGKDQFDLVKEHIRWFSNYRETSGLTYKIYISSVQTSKNKGEWEGLKESLSPYVDEFDMRSCSNQGGNMYVNNSTETIDASNLLGSLKPTQLKHKRCPDPFHRLVVTSEGYATVCVVDYKNYLTVANLHKNTIKEAWTNEVFVDLRKRHLSGNLDGLICKNCLHNSNDPSFPLMPDISRPHCEG